MDFLGKKKQKQVRFNVTYPPVAIPSLSLITRLNFSVHSSLSPHGPSHCKVTNASVKIEPLHHDGK